MTLHFISAIYSFFNKDKKDTRLSFTAFLIGSLFLFSCHTIANETEIKTFPHEILSSTVSTSFAPDGRLWRLIPTKKAIYVAFSNDYGSTYSKPTRVNKLDQKISLWPENPPAIEISN